VVTVSAQTVRLLRELAGLSIEQEQERLAPRGLDF
jgi:hypothetical protein